MKILEMKTNLWSRIAFENCKGSQKYDIKYGLSIKSVRFKFLKQIHFQKEDREKGRSHKENSTLKHS